MGRSECTPAFSEYIAHDQKKRTEGHDNRLKRRERKRERERERERERACMERPGKGTKERERLDYESALYAA
jgi:hypothetical protein